MRPPTSLLVSICTLTALALAPLKAVADGIKPYSPLGFARLEGSYENFVGAGRSEDGVRLAFGGGNHASEGLGDSFPWAEDDHGVLIGLGFNDMAVLAGDSIISFGFPFQKRDPSVIVPRGFLLKRGAAGEIQGLQMSVDATARLVTDPEGSPGEPVHLTMDLHLLQGSHTVIRDEGTRRIGGYPGDAVHWACVTLHFACRLDRELHDWDMRRRSPPGGMLLTDVALRLDPLEASTVRIQGGKSDRTYVVASFSGGLETGRIGILASRSPRERIYAKYDYSTFFPADPAPCDNRGVVTFISGILDSNRGILHRIANLYATEQGSSAFWMDPDGKDDDLRDIDDHKKIHSVADLLAIGSLGLTEGEELPGQYLALGPGSFHRRLIRLKDKHGCERFGMLETQDLN
jgi:hypothetical protein